LKTIDNSGCAIFQGGLIKEVILCKAGNAQIAGIPLKRMRTPTSARHAEKNANFLTIPATRRTAPMRVPMTESARKKNDLSAWKPNGQT
jgi:hypothetical protein